MTKHFITMKNCLFIAVVLLVTLFAAEFLLRTYVPFTFATIGHRLAKNTLLYGWGYNSHEIIKMRDPDTGEAWAQPANNHGWRDKDRTFDNRRRTYRILVLGDSITFGATVPADKVYTRILEDRLRKEGFNVEVLNIAYGGWGTDQQLEALKNEGLKYKPKLAIIQFCSNDLDNNMYFANENEERKGWKPFYYTINDNDQLSRHKNPYFMKKWNWKDRIKFQILKFEIGKRLYSIYFAYKWAESAVSQTEDGQLQRLSRYVVSRNQIDQLEFAFQLTKTNPLLQYLEENIDDELDLNELCVMITTSGYENDKETILKLLEKRWFHRYWARNMYYAKEQDINSPKWKLYFALVKEASSLIDQAGARLALFSQNDIAGYEWNVSWCRVSDDATSRRNWLSYSKIIEQLSLQHGIGFVENITPYQRSRNDPHPNIDGHEAIAKDIYLYLMKYHKGELESYRNLHRDGLS
ncbi:MAG: SGNH/GDSL hydrolase family protein [Deltaproteobacteria bacterium]|nr:SGNH/GDSL hydrolase family protein [Deltaproteobacteria bacterium]